MVCKSCGKEIPESAKFCPNCGAKVDKEEFERLNDKDNHRRGAMLHIKISNARLYNVPGMLAWLAAVAVAVSMAVWSYVFVGTPQIPVVILIFILLVIVFQILSRLVFLILDVATRRAYNDFIRRGGANGDAGTERGRNDYEYGRSGSYGDGYGYGQYSDYAQDEGSSYGKYGQYGASGSRTYESAREAYENAMALFHLHEPFTEKDLKKSRNKMIMNGKVHPDDGGDPEKFKELMNAYDLLMEYVGNRA